MASDPTRRKHIIVGVAIGSICLVGGYLLYKKHEDAGETVGSSFVGARPGASIKSDIGLGSGSSLSIASSAAGSTGGGGGVGGGAGSSGTTTKGSTTTGSTKTGSTVATTVATVTPVVASSVASSVSAGSHAAALVTAQPITNVSTTTGTGANTETTADEAFTQDGVTYTGPVSVNAATSDGGSFASPVTPQYTAAEVAEAEAELASQPSGLTGAARHAQEVSNANLRQIIKDG